ncbi:autotransporter-associated beta strand repeat-containing protein, partial [Limnohabitans sp. Rim47]|uniref:beta strand repeat-containing protein n=1 Tax=Limnohabitans sp. Rim47 TaxID=1100721 RepID=UPI0004784DC9
VSGTSNLGANVTTTGTQTYGGAVTLSGGDRTLTASTVNTQSTLAGGGNALTITGAADIGGAYTGLTHLSVSGTAKIGANVTTTSTQTYLGAATLSANAELAGSGINMAAVSLQSGSLAYTLSINNTDDDSKIEGVVSGTGALVKKGMGTLSLNGDNTYSGTTNVNAGTLKLGHAHALGAAASASGTTVGANGTLDLNELSVQEPVTVAGGRILNGVLAGDMTLTADSVIEAGAGSSVTLSGDISGSFGLTLSGAGVITLSGDNTYTGETTISSGTVVVASNTGLGSAAGGTTLASGATLDLAGVTVAAEGLVLQGGTLKDASSQWGGTISMTADSTFDIAQGDTLTVTGAISGTGRLTKTSGGILVLSHAANAYEGGTTLSGGVLQVSADRNLGAVPGAVIANNITLNGGTLQATADMTLSALRGITVTANSKFSTDASVSVNYAGVIAGSAGLTKSGSGSLVLTGTNTHTGSLTVAGGTLQLGNGTTGALAEASNIVIDSGGKLTLNRSNDFTVANVISGAGALQQSGSATATLTGNNSNFMGSTSLAAGLLNVGNANALGSNSTGSIQFDGGALQYSTDNQVDYSARISNAVSQTIKIDTNGQAVTFAAGLSGSGVTMTKLGSGTLTLSGANTYSGDTNVNAGTLKVTGTLADSTDVVVASAASYRVQASDTIQSLSGAGAVALATGVTLITGDVNNQTISGVISGTGTLSKVGSGTLTLSAANTYAGDTQVNAGILKVTGTLADITDVVVASGATYHAEATDTIASLSGAGGIVLGSGVTLTTGDTNNQTISGVISGAGALRKVGSGALTLTGGNTLTGLVSIEAGTLVANHSAGQALETAAKVHVSAGAVLNAGTPSAGTTTLQSLAGAGDVVVGADQRLKVTAGLAGDEFSGVISGGSGSGGLEVSGGTLTLSGVNTYTGNTDITGGATLKIKGAGSIVASGAVHVSGSNGAVLDISGASAGVALNNLSSASNLYWFCAVGQQHAHTEHRRLPRGRHGGQWHRWLEQNRGRHPDPERDQHLHRWHSD